MNNTSKLLSDAVLFVSPGGEFGFDSVSNSQTHWKYREMACDWVRYGLHVRSSYCLEVSQTLIQEKQYQRVLYWCVTTYGSSR